MNACCVKRQIHFHITICKQQLHFYLVTALYIFIRFKVVDLKISREIKSACFSPRN